MRISDWSSDVCSSDLRAHPGGARFRRGDAATAARQLLGRLADARGARRPPLLAARCAAARRAVEPPRSRSGDVARGFPQKLSRDDPDRQPRARFRSEEHTSELQSLMRISYAVFCLKKKKKQQKPNHNNT